MLYYSMLVDYTVGFHNFNLRNFNLRVSNPNKLIVDVFLTRCRISMCQGLGPKKHDEISEIDRTGTPISSLWKALAIIRGLGSESKDRGRGCMPNPRSADLDFSGLSRSQLLSSAKPHRATKEGQWVLRTLLHMILCSAWFYEPWFRSKATFPLSHCLVARCLHL